MKKYVYIITDSDDNLKSHTSAYSSEQSAHDYAIELNRLRLANGLSFMDYKIVKLCVEL